VRSLAFSPDGKLLASGGSDLKIKLWDVTTGKELRTLTGHFASVLALAFSPDGKLLASRGKNEEQVRIWDLATGTELKSVTGAADARIQFSPDGQLLVVASSHGSIKLWNVGSGTELKTLQTDEQGGSVTSVSFSPDGKILASIEPNDAIKLWDVATGKLSKVMPIADDSLDGLMVFKKDGKTLMSFTEGVVKLWDVVSGSQLATMPVGAKQPSDHVALSPDGKLLARVGLQEGDQGFKLLEVATGKELKPPRVSDDGYSVESLAFSPNGAVLAIGDDVGAITLWEVDDGKELKTLKGHSFPAPEVAFSSDGKMIATGSEDKTIKLWNMSTWGVTVLTGHSKGVTCVAFSPDNRILASGSEDQTIKLWDVATTKELRVFQGSKNAYDGFIAITFSPDGKTLAGLDESAIHFWDVISGNEKRVINLNLQDDVGFTVSFSSDGENIACGIDHTIKIWNVATGAELKTLTGHSDRVASVAFSRDRKTLASSSKDGTVKIWDVATGMNLKTLTGHKQPVYAVAFSPDSKMLASTSIDRTIRLWDAATGMELKSIAVNSDWAGPLVFSADGQMLASGSLSGSTYLWDVSNGTLLARLVALDEKDWVITTPDGRFDGTTEGIKLLHYVQDNKPIPLDSFFEKFYTPKLWQQVVAREKVPINNAVDFTKSIKPPPQVRIVSPKAGATSNSDTAQIVVEATDQGGGVEDIRLYQNGKLVSEDTRLFTRETTQRKIFDVTLLPGINTLRVTAFNVDRTEATPDEIKIELKAVEASSNLYILAIGLNEYKNTRYNLNYARADAKAFADGIEQRARGIFKQINKRVLFDAEATRTNIEVAFNQIINQARPQDALIFYYAGHGAMSLSGDGPADFYLVPHDVIRIYGDGDGLTTNGIAARTLSELLKSVRAQKQLIILDACESGGALEAISMRGAAEEKAIMQLARAVGVTVLASAGQDQIATEFDELGHGVFTYALLKGLNGEADGSPRDGKITIKELEAYINDQVPELTKRYRGKRQDPNSWTRGQDFPIALR
jgi:WD40 repeat protein